jgi:hypothetical protein
MSLTVPASGDVVAASWGAEVSNRLNRGNYMPFAVPAGWYSGMASTQNSSLLAVSASKAGCMLVPFPLAGSMLIQSVTLRQGSTASARSAEFRLYYDDGTTTLQFVTGTDGTFSFTPSAADDRTANVSTPGTLLYAGMYWLAVRNTSASQTFVVRRGADLTELSGNVYLQDNTPNVLALGSTLDTTTFTGGVSLPLVRLNGRVLGGSSAF